MVGLLGLSTMSGTGQSRRFGDVPATSALPLIADARCEDQQVRKVPTGDINCHDCDVRSLAEPELDRRVFAKLKHLLRKAAARSAEISASQSAKFSEHYAHRMRQLFPTLCPIRKASCSSLRPARARPAARRRGPLRPRPLPPPRPLRLH